MVELSDDEDLLKEGGYPHDWKSNVVYLNNAGEAHLSPKVQEAGLLAISRPPWDINVEKERQKIRQIFASFINASSSDIAMMPSTAFAMSFAARNIQRSLTGKVGKILVIEDQMCSAIFPWQQLCRDFNFDIKLEIVKYPTGEGGWTEAVLSEMSDEVLVVCLPPLHWSDGSLLDLEAIGNACKLHDSIFIVDATQAVGIMSCDVKRFQASILACSVHKWLRGPPGMSLVYVSPELHDSWLPLDLHGRSRLFPEGIAWEAYRHEMGPRGYSEKFYSDARKFDSGGQANPILIPMLCAAMEEVALIDTQEAQETLRVLLIPLLKWAKVNQFVLPPGPHASHLIGLRPCHRKPEELLEIYAKLKQRGIYIAVRCGLFRISPYLSTTTADIRRLIKGFEETIL